MADLALEQNAEGERATAVGAVSISNAVFNAC
jgi:hypothetical protein